MQEPEKKDKRKFYDNNTQFLELCFMRVEKSTEFEG